MSTQAELMACMVSSWCHVFKAVTHKTILIPLPKAFVEYLVADGVYLAENSEALGKRAVDPYDSDDGWESDSGSAGEAPQAPEFPELLAEMRRAIVELGGVVVPKFTWSCPKDAVWMTLGQTLACHNPDEVLLLLKSSDRVAHDICHAFDSCVDAAASDSEKPDARGTCGREGGQEEQQGQQEEQQCGQHCQPAAAGGQQAAVQHVLALRRWHDLRPEREFRCFVRGQELVGISQRDITKRYPALAEEMGEIQQRIQGFHQRHIQGRFPLPDYTYDVYVATSADTVKLVDFNPIGGTTSPLLFSWEELPYHHVFARRGGSGAEAAEASMTGAVAARVEAATGLDPGPAAAEGGAEGLEGPSAMASRDVAYLEQLRRVQGLTLSSAPDPATGTRCPFDACCGSAVSAPEAHLACEQEQLLQQHREAPAQQAAHCAAAHEPSPRGASAAAAAATATAVEFRIVEEDGPLRASKLAYGVPFDLVDASEGSALDHLMKQMGEAAPAELLEALGARRG